jgi:hypothetical protein
MFLAALSFAVGACEGPKNIAAVAACQGLSKREIRQYFDYGDSVLIAETSLVGTPQKDGVGEWGRGFAGSIIRTFSVTPVRFFKNAGNFPNSSFNILDFESYSVDGAFLGGPLLPDSKAISLIAITRSKSQPPGREIFASHICDIPEGN